MSHLVFHKEYRQHTCGNHVDFFRTSFFRLFSTGLSLGFCTGFVIEKPPHQGVFLVFNTTTNTTISNY